MREKTADRRNLHCCFPTVAVVSHGLQKTEFLGGLVSLSLINTRVAASSIALALVASASVSMVTTSAYAADAAVSTSVGVVKAPTPIGTESAGKSKKTTAKLSASISGRRLQDQYVKSNTSGPGLEAAFAHEFNRMFSATVVVGSVMNTGTASSLFSAEGSPSSFVYANEASLSFKPNEAILVRGGVIETRFSVNQSIFRTSGFPGVTESYKIGGDRYNLTLSATQTMPTASGLSKNYVDSDTTPYLLLHSLGGNLGEKDDRVSLSAAVTHFVFDELPANAAHDSRFAGNSVVGTGASAARFQYEFEGIETSALMRARANRNLRFELRAANLRNWNAPVGKRSGYNATLTPIIDVGNFEIKPEVGIFYNESDTLPATYTSSGVGQNNRNGWLAGLKAKFKDENVTISTRWVEANKIAPNPYTADRTIFTVGVETSYDLL